MTTRTHASIEARASRAGLSIEISNTPRRPAAGRRAGAATSRLLAGLAGLAAAGVLPAQTAPAPAAEQAWAAVVAQRRAAAASKVTPIRGVVAANREEALRHQQDFAERARQHRATAQAAREFHLRHPSHPQAAEARQLEVVAGLDGITPNDKAYERTALAAARAYRTDPAKPLADRIQVAHAMESFAISRRTLGRHWFDNPYLAETMLDRLRGEFGEQPEIWGHFLSLAQDTHCDAGRDVALRIVQSPAAPAPTQEMAQRILERYALVRQPLDLPLTTAQGQATTLGRLAGRTTLVCLWDGSRYPEGPPGLHEFKARPLPNTKWIYVSVGPLGVRPTGRKPAAAPPGTICVEPLGRASPLVAKLKVQRLPYVFVLDDRQRLSGYGRIDEIPTLLAGIGRPVLP